MKSWISHAGTIYGGIALFGVVAILLGKVGGDAAEALFRALKIERGKGLWRHTKG